MAKSKKKFRDIVKQTPPGKSLGFGRDKARKILKGR